MTHESGFEITPRIQAALDELMGIIAARFPDATFDVKERFDPPGISLAATVDIDDTDEVAELIGDRLLEMQVYEGLPIYIVPLQPMARVMAEMRRQADARAMFRPTG